MREYDKVIITNKMERSIDSAYVVKAEENTLTVRVENELLFEVDQEVFLYIYSHMEGERKYEALVQFISEKLITFYDVRPVEIVQKRNNVRVNVLLKYHVKQKIVNNERIELDPPAEICIMNISATGMGINVQVDQKNPGTELDVDTRYVVIFKECKKPMELQFDVIRKDPFANFIRYGCVFRDLDEKVMDEIYKYVLNVQIEQLKKHRRR